MNTIMKLFGLKREAVLLDSWLYIAKAMCAISVGFILGRAFAITRLDMISVLLGVMYNLEPINVLGLKGGFNQLFASALGALITGFLVYLMGYQVTFLTVALGIGLTLYVALKIDYRMVSPVAIFTSIYMTQLIQTNDLGLPSVLLTFRLRIVALGLGVIIALVFNFLFSLFYYQKIGRKRVEFVKIQAVNAIRHTIQGLKERELAANSEFILANVFNDVDMVKANLETMMKEKFIPFNRQEKEKLDNLLKVVMQIKNIAHCAYDCLFITNGLHETVSDEDLNQINDILHVFASIDFTNIKKINFEFHPVNELDHSRIHQNVKLMVDECTSILTIYNGLN